MERRGGPQYPVEGVLLPWQARGQGHHAASSRADSLGRSLAVRPPPSRFSRGTAPGRRPGGRT